MCRVQRIDYRYGVQDGLEELQMLKRATQGTKNRITNAGYTTLQIIPPNLLYQDFYTEWLQQGALFLFLRSLTDRR